MSRGGDSYTRLVAGCLFPVQCWMKGHTTVAVRRSLEATQWLSSDRLAELQASRLRRLIQIAASEVPYYREVFARHGLATKDIATPADLAQLPLLDKPLIRAHSAALKRPGAQGLAKFTTGGSSGSPLQFMISRERVSHDVAAKWRATRWWGVDIGDPEIVLWGSPIEVGAQDRVRAWRDALQRTRLLPAFDMSTQRLDGFLAELREFQPRMLFGYPSALAVIAQHAERRGVRLDDLGIKVAFVTSERLYPYQREDISRVFGCPVANGYGGRDAGFIAHECPAGNLHITAEDVVVEIIDPTGRVLPPGELGEIVVTHLATADFPFIRYRTGDMAALSPNSCDCGRGLPLLQQLEGRSTDFVMAADGTLMHGLALIYVLREETGVENFRIIQETLGWCRIELVVNERWDTAAAQRVERGIAARLGPSVRVSLELQNQLAPDPSGKHRYVQSRITGLGSLTTPPTDSIPRS